MRIDVKSPSREFDDQTRAYAEFRAFSTLARFNDAVEHANVSLKHLPAGLQSVVCVVDVTLSDGTRARISARGAHPYSAINRAAERVSGVLRRHSGVAMTS
jgi:ribosome-associated translation inhibitor RaiA